jgi:hypothetical protein
MIQNLPEGFLYDRLPNAIITGDERGLVEAVVSGFQDRLEDFRSYARKIGAFYTPGVLPDTSPNAILVTLTSDQGVTFTRSLDVQSDTPVTNGAALTAWAIQQLNVQPSAVSTVCYGTDLLRFVSADVLGYLAATLGAVLYQSIMLSGSTSAQTAANVALVQTWFPRLKIKGTPDSFEVLGRMLGFDDVRFTALWTRLSPRQPDDVGDPVNDPDFAASPEYPPKQVIDQYYNPFAYRDGPYFSWTTTVDSGTNSNNFYSQVIDGFNPWINVILLGSLAGTNIPAVYNGTVTHPANGTYVLEGGLPNFKATVTPFGSSVEFQAVAEGDSFNGLAIVTSTPGTLYNATGTVVVISGSLCNISISDRLSAIKYRSSYFDIGLTSSMDNLEEIFGSRAATTNKDLQANPTLTSDGTAVSPYRPWVSGSIIVQETTSDWVTSSGTNVSVFEARVEANPAAPLSSRQLNIDSVLAAGVQVIQAFEEVRPATRQPRQSQFGFLWDDQTPYAAYVSYATLFTTASGTNIYSGTYDDTPPAVYPARVLVTFAPLVPEVIGEGPPNEYRYLYNVTVGDPYFWNPNGLGEELQDNVIGILLTSAGSFTPQNTPVFVANIIGSNKPSEVTPLTDYVAYPETSPTNNELFYYKVQDPPLTIYGTFTEDNGSYWFNIYGGAVPSGMVVIANWAAFTTEVIRDEPSLTEKNIGSGEENVFPVYSGDTNIQARPEDLDDSTLVDEVTDDFGWRRDLVAGGELNDLTIYQAGTEIGIDALTPQTVFRDHRGVDLNVFGIVSQYQPIRVSIQVRPTLDDYQPGNLAIGYQGEFQDTSQYSPNDTGVIKLPFGTVSKGNTDTDYDTLFEPGYGLFHVGIAQGVMVADLPGFFGTHHRERLVGWFPFNEHPDNDLPPMDRSVYAGSLTPSGIVFSDRTYDDIRGWSLAMAQGTAISALYRDINQEITTSFWINITVLPQVEETIVQVGPAEFACDGTNLYAYLQDNNSNPQLVGSTPIVEGWQFVYIRAADGYAFVNFSTLAAFGTETPFTDALAPLPGVNSVTVSSVVVEYNIHDLRVWNMLKSEADMDLVRYHDPTPTLCTYPLGYVYTVDHQDRYGIQVLPSGWAVPGDLPASYRRSWQGLVRRYSAMGSYYGEDRFKEVGIGEGRPLPSTYHLGSQFTTLTSVGTATFSTTSGYLPGDSTLWEHSSNASGSYVPGTYAYLAFSSAASAAGTGFPVSYVSSGTTQPWPNFEVQTNVFRDMIWATNGPGQPMYEVTLDGSGTYTYLVFEEVIRGRTAEEIAVSPIFGPLVATGSLSTVVDGVMVTGTITGSTGTIYFPSGSQSFDVSSLYVSDQPTGPYVVNLQQLTSTAAYDGTSTLTSFYMYLNSAINVEVSNAYDAWTDQGNTVQDNGVNYSAAPQIVYFTGSGTYLNTPVLGEDGVLEFQNTSNLPAGDYVLTVVSGQVGQPDPDLLGFDVTLTVNTTILDVTLMSGQFNGQNGYNLTGTSVFPVQITDPVNGNWLLSFDWESALTDPATGSQRQLAIYSYSLRQLSTEPYEVQVAPLASPCAPIITLLSAGSLSTPGGWFEAVNSFGTAAGYAHESTIYSTSDTVTNTLPISEIMTSLTNERREDVIYTGTDVVISDAGSYIYPTFFGGTVAVTPAGLFQVGQTGTFSVSGYGDLYDIYSYVWHFWDGSGTATPGPSVMKVINTGSNPFGAPTGLQVSCLPVGIDGQFTTLYGTFAANNGPIIVPGDAFITNNDQYFPYATEVSATAFDFERQPLAFSWYTGTTFLSSGTSSYVGSVAGTWSGNGTSFVGEFSGTQNYFATVIDSPTPLTLYVTDNSGGTTTLDFSLRGQEAPPPIASAGAGFAGVSAATLGVQRIGVGQSVDFTVYANTVTNGTLSFVWEFFGSNNWTVTGQSAGTTTLLPNGGYQNTVVKDISGEVVAVGTQKTVEAICDIALTTPGSQSVQTTQVAVEVVLLSNLPPSGISIVVSDNGVPIVNGIGTQGDVIEFDATGTDPNNQWVWYEWNFNQPFLPNTGLYWGAKVRLDTSRYTPGQSLNGLLTATDLLGGTLTVILPDILLQ